MRLILSLTLLLFAASSFVYSQVSIGGAGNSALYKNTNLQVNNTATKDDNQRAGSSIYRTNSGRQTVRTMGIANYVADIYVATFNLIVEADAKKDAADAVNKRLNGFKQDLIKKGIKSENITTELVEFVPAFEVGKAFLKSAFEKPKGFTCQKTLTVVYGKSTELDWIMSTALEHDIYDLVKVDYHLSNLAELKADLKKKCLTVLDEEIAFTRKMIPSIDGSMSLFENFDVIMPETQYSEYSAFRSSASQLSKDKMIDKTSTKYYKQLNYSNFQVVINPIVQEPVVQIVYEVGIQYIVPEKIDDNTYKLITPTGAIIDVKK